MKDSQKSSPLCADMRKEEIMTKKEAINVVANFLITHLVAGDMIDDDCYNQEVKALSILYPKDERFKTADS